MSVKVHLMWVIKWDRVDLLSDMSHLRLQDLQDLHKHDNSTYISRISALTYVG